MCGEKLHEVTWRRGKLVLEDHDLLAEQALKALGAQPPVCLQVLDAWRRMRSSDLLRELLFRDATLPALELAYRRTRYEIETQRAKHPALTFPPQRSHVLQRRHEQAVAERMEREERMWELSLIEALPAPLRRALALSIIVNAERHWHEDVYRRRHGPNFEDVLTAIAAPLVEQSARRWRRNVKPYASFVMEPRLLLAPEQPGVAAWLDTDGASVLLSLSLSWFTEIWVRGIALVDDCFVLRRAGRSPDGASFPVEAVRWERDGRNTSKSVQAPAIVTRGRYGDWSLHWA